MKVKGIIVLSIALLSVACETKPYVKIEVDDNTGTVTRTVRSEQRDWWSNLDQPDWMNLKEETIYRDNVIVETRKCNHVPTKPEELKCHVR